MADWASDSGHFYMPVTGEPFYTVPYANGKGERPATLRDARKVGAYPSVTTVLALAAKPALAAWLQRQAILAALTLPRLPDEAEEAWLARVLSDSKQEGKDAADRGTLIHAALESAYRKESVAKEWWPWIRAVQEEVFKHTGAQNWRPEKSFVDDYLGYGGKIDLHSEEWVIDFKGKDGLAKIDLYDEHYCQLGAYRRLVGAPKRCAIVFVDRNTPAAKFVEADGKDVARGLEMFSALLDYYRAKTDYAPTVRQ